MIFQAIAVALIGGAGYGLVWGLLWTAAIFAENEDK